MSKTTSDVRQVVVPGPVHNAVVVRDGAMVSVYPADGPKCVYEFSISSSDLSGKSVTSIYYRRKSEEELVFEGGFHETVEVFERLADGLMGSDKPSAAGGAVHAVRASWKGALLRGVGLGAVLALVVAGGGWMALHSLEPLRGIQMRSHEDLGMGENWLSQLQSLPGMADQELSGPPSFPEQEQARPQPIPFDPDALAPLGSLEQAPPHEEAGVMPEIAPDPDVAAGDSSGTEEAAATIETGPAPGEETGSEEEARSPVDAEVSAPEPSAEEEPEERAIAGTGEEAAAIAEEAISAADGSDEDEAIDPLEAAVMAAIEKGDNPQRLLSRLSHLRAAMASGQQVTASMLEGLPESIVEEFSQSIAVAEDEEDQERLVSLPQNMIPRDRYGIPSLPQENTWVYYGGRIILPLPGGGTIASVSDIEEFGLEP